MLWVYDISLVCTIVFILLLWNSSSIVETFAKLTHTKKLFKIDEFYKYRSENDSFCTYPSFLFDSYPCFITELLSCNICLTFWSNVLSLPIILYIFPHTFLWSNIYLFPINYVISLLILLSLKILYNNQN